MTTLQLFESFYVLTTVRISTTEVTEFFIERSLRRASQAEARNTLIAQTVANEDDDDDDDDDNEHDFMALEENPRLLENC